MPVFYNRRQLNSFEEVLDCYGDYKKEGRYGTITEKRIIHKQTKIDCKCNVCNKYFILSYRFSYKNLLEENRTLCRVCKSKETKQEKYGNSTFTNRKKAQQTTLDKYGVENAMHLEIFMEKLRKTKKERYGKEYYNNPEASSLTRTGVTHTEERKKNISKARKKFFETEKRDDNRKLISEKAKERYKDKTNHPMYGKKMSEEHKRKMIESNSRTWAEKVKNGEANWSKNKYDSGWLFSKKLQKKIWYRSSYEKAFYFLIDYCDKIKTFNVEPFVIPYEFEGFIKNYIPDTLIEFQDGLKHLIEIKPRYFINAPKNQAKFSVAKEYCKENDIDDFIIVTERDFWRYCIIFDDGSFFLNLPSEFKRDLQEKLRQKYANIA